MEKYGTEVLNHSLLNLHKRLQNSMRRDQAGILDVEKRVERSTRVKKNDMQ